MYLRARRQGLRFSKLRQAGGLFLRFAHGAAKMAAPRPDNHNENSADPEARPERGNLEMRTCFVLSLITGLLLGCASTGSYVEPAEARKVSRARTGAAVIKALGPPSVTVPTGNGKTMWVYVGQHKSPSLDSFIPYVGAITGRENQICSQLSLLVDDKTGAVSDMKYASARDSDWRYNTDENCR